MEPSLFQDNDIKVLIIILASIILSVSFKIKERRQNKAIVNKTSVSNNPSTSIKLQDTNTIIPVIKIDSINKKELN